MTRVQLERPIHDTEQLGRSRKGHRQPDNPVPRQPRTGIDGSGQHPADIRPQDTGSERELLAWRPQLVSDQAGQGGYRHREEPQHQAGSSHLPRMPVQIDTVWRRVERVPKPEGHDQSDSNRRGTGRFANPQPGHGNNHPYGESRRRDRETEQPHEVAIAPNAVGVLCHVADGRPVPGRRVGPLLDAGG